MEKELAALKTQIEDIDSKLIVELQNGKKKKMYVNDAVTEIWTDIEVVRDANKIHKLNKKYKVYYMIWALIAILLGANIKDALIGFLDKL